MSINESESKLGNKKNQTAFIWAIAFVAIAALGILAYVMSVGGETPATVGGADPVEAGSGAVNQIITTSATVSYAGIDALQGGTTVGVTAHTSKNGQAFKTGVTSANQGDLLDVLFVNDTTYHNAFVSAEKVAGVDFPVEAKLYGNSTLTVTVYATTGSSVLTNGGGATNQTATSGAPYTHKIELTGQSKKSTNDMVCVLEANDKTKAKTMELQGFGAVQGGKVPQSFTPSATASELWVYQVPAIEGAALRTGSVYLESEDGQSMAGKLAKMSCYTKENFIDSVTGDRVYDIEDSQGTLQSMATYTYTWAYT